MDGDSRLRYIVLCRVLVDNVQYFMRAIRALAVNKEILFLNCTPVPAAVVYPTVILIFLARIVAGCESSSIGDGNC
jgi:hypothetical protein